MNKLKRQSSTLRVLALITFLIGAAASLAGCACPPPAPVTPTSTSWHIGDTHPEPCGIYADAAGEAFLDADAKFWVFSSPPPFFFSGDNSACLRAGALVLPTTAGGTLYWEQGAEPPFTKVPMSEVTAEGIVMAQTPTLPSVKYYGHMSTDVLAVTCVTADIVSVGGDYYEPAPDSAYPAGQGPQCALYSHLTLVSSGELLATYPDGQQVSLKPHAGSLTTGGTCPPD